VAYVLTGMPFHDLRVSVAYTIGDFLHDLEAVRGNSPATRNARLAAIHSLFRYAALSEASDNA
jgi:integrase/recombinase XerD